LNITKRLNFDRLEHTSRWVKGNGTEKRNKEDGGGFPPGSRQTHAQIAKASKPIIKEYGAENIVYWWERTTCKGVQVSGRDGASRSKHGSKDLLGRLNENNQNVLGGWLRGKGGMMIGGTAA